MRLLDSGDYSPRFVDLLVRDPATMCLITLAAFAIVLCLVLGQRQRLAALERVSMLDTLTGLLSGPYFDAERWPALVGRSSAPLAVILVDLDRLKPINDTWGHVAGDRYIAGAASILRGALRRGVDHVVRLHSAGDEFLIVLSCPTAERARTIAESLLSRLRAAEISASIGVAFTARVSYRERAELRTLAERAMYEAKRSGRGRVVLAVSPAPEPPPACPEPIAPDDETQPIVIAVPEPIEDAAARTRAYAVGQSADLIHSSRAA
jgi:diguanylate cyclase (GGDEF)-like protein